MKRVLSRFVLTALCLGLAASVWHLYCRWTVLNRIRGPHGSRAGSEAAVGRFSGFIDNVFTGEFQINGMRFTLGTAAGASDVDWVAEAIQSGTSDGWTVERAMELETGGISNVIVLRRGKAMRCLALMERPALGGDARVLKMECDDLEVQERWVRDFAAGAGGDAPGDDAISVPRPDRARRVFSMVFPGHQVAVYHGWASEEHARAEVDHAFSTAQWKQLLPGWILGTISYESPREANRCWVRVVRHPTSNEVMVTYVTQNGGKGL